MSRSVQAWLFAGLIVFLGGLVTAPTAGAAFGFSELAVTSRKVDGSLEAQAGAHPFSYETRLGFNTLQVGGKTLVDEEVKDLTVEQMAGLVGRPDATPRCAGTAFLEHITTTIDFLPKCDNNSVVGVAALRLEANKPGPPEFYHAPVYNLEAPPGAAAELGFYATDERVTIELVVSEKPPYNIVARLTNVPQVVQLLSSSLTIWGDPADPAHDAVRGSCVVTAESGPTEEPESRGLCPSETNGSPTEQQAFLTLPRACEGSLSTLFSADSWQRPGVFQAAPASSPFAATECASLGFSPTIATKTTNEVGESPTGLGFSLDVSDPGLTDPTKRASSDIKRTVVTLPEGFTTNSSAASGLTGCSIEELDRERSSSSPGEGCPQASKIGTAEVETPLLEESIDGELFLAKPFENEFHSLIAIYLVLRNPQLGIGIHQEIEVVPNPTTGGLTATTDNIPQLPFSHLLLNFRAGARAPLMTPQACGTFPVSAQLFPYSDPEKAVNGDASVTVAQGAGGGACGAPPNSPAFSAGTTTPAAGGYSPFVFKLNRSDGSQRFASISSALPKGLVARLAGVPYCPEAGLIQAASRTAAGDAAREQADPSCPAASAIGTASVAAGAGPEPFNVSGQVYLAGPYKGAPLSLEVITPAIAGPFDLGVVAVRTALEVNPETAQITAVSDQIPTILQGLPLDVRTIVLSVSRNQFTLNPTSCNPTVITGDLTSVLDQQAPLSSRFQVGGCNQLKFKPKLRISLKGSTKRAGHPALKAVVTYPRQGAYANIARAQVNLPHSEFLDQSNLNKTCTKPVLLEGKCPAKSIYGKAKVWTPLLEKPLEGPVYLVGGYGYQLPALVAELNGQIRVLLKAKVDSGPNKGIRSTFEAIPDAPVSRFVLEMKGGKKYSLLENSENLCRKPRPAIARFTAQNGLVDQFRPQIAIRCKKANGKRHPNAGR